MNIRETAFKLRDKYNQKYKEWCIENPGKILNGNLIKIDPLEKASYCNDIDEVKAMRKYYEIALRSATGPHGFRFSMEAMDELINELENGKL